LLLINLLIKNNNKIINYFILKQVLLLLAFPLSLQGTRDEMSGNPKRRRSASMKQMIEETALENIPTLPPTVTPSLKVRSPSAGTVSTADTTAGNASSRMKVKSSRRASFQLSNTINSQAKASGVDHLINVANDTGITKKGMRDLINELKDEIEAKGIFISICSLIIKFTTCIT
jgi:hypothetical protein